MTKRELLAYNELAYSVKIEDVYETGKNKNRLCSLLFQGQILHIAFAVNVSQKAKPSGIRRHTEYKFAVFIQCNAKISDDIVPVFFNVMP